MMPHSRSSRGARLAAAALFAALVPTAAAGGTKTVFVYGTIYDTATKKPLPGAHVMISDEGSLTERLVTDESGRYSAVGLYPGRVTVMVAQAGFSSDELTCLVRAGNSAAFDLAIAPNTGDVEHVRYYCPPQSVTQDTYQR